MADRPDNPNAGKPQTPEIEIPDEEVVHHVSTRKKRKKGVGGESMQLQMTSRIDVVFLLLIYFASGLSANIPHVIVFGDQDIVGAGASGAVAGLFGAFLVRFANQKLRFVLLPLLPTVVLPGWLAFRTGKRSCWRCCALAAR